MRNKRILSSVIILMFVLSALSAREFLIPYHGFSGIPIDSPIYNVVSDPTEWMRDDESTVYNNYKGNGKLSNYYYDWNMVATGGVVEVSDKEDVIITISVSSPSGLNFISLSQPSIYRPYAIQLRLLADDKKNGADRAFPVATFDQNGGTKIFKLSELYENGQTNKANQAMHFDIFINLPGDRSYVPHEKGTLVAEDDTMRLESGAIIPILELDDYSSVVDIKMNVRYTDEPEDAGTDHIISVPLNGYFSKSSDSGSQQTKSSCALSIRPMAACANIDIEHQAGAMIHIADISFINSRFDSDISNFKKMGLFFSSSPSPFASSEISPQHFRLVHSEMPSADPTLLNERNHINYTLHVFPGATFDGTMTVDSSAKNLDTYKDSMIIPQVDDEIGIDEGRKVKMQFYEKELYLQLDAKHDKMIKGKYVSTIYVHVVTEK